MAITTINSTDSGASSLTKINDNFTDLDTTKADLASPTFTGTPSLPTGTTGVTQSASDNSTKLATTAYVDNSMSTFSIIYTSGISTKDLSNSSTTQTIAHGLSKIPKKIKLIANYNTSSYTLVNSNGVFTSSGNFCVAQGQRTDGTERWNISSNTYAIALSSTYVIATTTGQTGVISVDNTNITITWTKYGSPTGTISFLWEAE